VPRDWDRHYADAARAAALRDDAPDPLLVQVAEMAPPGDALDLACGTGRHAIYLASLGWRVTAVDSSAVAIGLVRERAGGLPVEARTADLESGQFPIAPAAYDLICDFHYLHRALFPQIREGVRPGGLFVAAIHLVDANATGGPHNPAFLLAPGELPQEFAAWKILFYSEAAELGPAQRALRASARIIARRA